MQVVLVVRQQCVSDPRILCPPPPIAPQKSTPPMTRSASCHAARLTLMVRMLVGWSTHSHDSTEAEHFCARAGVESEAAVRSGQQKDAPALLPQHCMVINSGTMIPASTPSRFFLAFMLAWVHFPVAQHDSQAVNSAADTQRNECEVRWHTAADGQHTAEMRRG
jgi:hypothetical protein